MGALGVLSRLAWCERGRLFTAAPRGPDPGRAPQVVVASLANGTLVFWEVRCISDIPKGCYVSELVVPLQEADMPQTLVVSGRGQITLPAATRKRLGIKGGDVVILEDRGNEIVLKPGMVLEVQHYCDDQIAQWDADDRLEDRERTRILEAVTGQK